MYWLVQLPDLEFGRGILQLGYTPSTRLSAITFASCASGIAAEKPPAMLSQTYLTVRSYSCAISSTISLRLAPPTVYLSRKERRGSTFSPTMYTPGSACSHPPVIIRARDKVGDGVLGKAMAVAVVVT